MERVTDRLRTANEEANDETSSRQIVELLVVFPIRVDTEVVDGRQNARLTINYTAAASRCFAGF